MEMMKAAVQNQYGGPEVLKLKQIPKQTPTKNEILVRIKASTASMGDYRMRSLVLPDGFGLIGFFMGLQAPKEKVLGVEFSGIVEAVGPAVETFEVGDEIFGIDGNNMGGYAEYKVMPETIALAHKPSRLSFNEAAAVAFGAGTAIHFIRTKAKLQAGETVLVNGASGAVGSAAVPLAKHLGATVTAVCGTSSIELVRSIGADVVIDYQKEDFTAMDKKYDLIFDAVGNVTYQNAKHCLTDNGRMALVVGGVGAMLQTLFNKKIIAEPAKEEAANLKWLAEVIEQGHYQPLIDCVYPLDDIVAAHQYLDTGRKKGNIVIEID